MGDAQGISLLCLSTAASALARRTCGNGIDPQADVQSAFLQVGIGIGIGIGTGIGTGVGIDICIGIGIGLGLGGGGYLSILVVFCVTWSSALDS